jgi:hypothetical protein
MQLMTERIHSNTHNQQKTPQHTSYNIPQTLPQPTHTALQQSQRTTEMTMTVGRRRHGIIVAAPGCQE